MLRNLNMLETLTNVATCFSQGETLREQAGQPVQRSGLPMTKDK
ncbi:hypothetical protein [Tolypothrix sp. PCC 7910]|nr:hypothetical protein [Tolypothrix sp. PCC 7910]